MSEAPKLTKKELQTKIDDLEKELYLYKNKTQLARNYDILQKEYDELEAKFLYKKKEWLTKHPDENVDCDSDDTEEDNL